MLADDTVFGALVEILDQWRLIEDFRAPLCKQVVVAYPPSGPPQFSPDGDGGTELGRDIAKPRLIRQRHS